jgi:hypothetical protein
LLIVRNIEGFRANPSLEPKPDASARLVPHRVWGLEIWSFISHHLLMSLHPLPLIFLVPHFLEVLSIMDLKVSIDFFQV